MTEIKETQYEASLFWSDQIVVSLIGDDDPKDQVEQESRYTSREQGN
jgi:hypothetical protein